MIRSLFVTSLAVFALAAPAAAKMPAQSAKLQAAAVTIPPPPEGMGQVVFFRSSIIGAAVNCTVREGEQVLNRLPTGRYFVHNTTPGQHTYRTRSESHDILNVEVTAGQTSFVRCAIGAGFMVGRPRLANATEGDFRQRTGLDEMPAYVPPSER